MLQSWLDIPDPKPSPSERQIFPCLKSPYSGNVGIKGQYVTHWKRPWCWEGLGAGGEGDDRGWDGWMALLTQWTWVWVNSGSWWSSKWWSSKLMEFKVMDREAWRAVIHGVAKSWTRPSDWTELNWMVGDIEYLFIYVFAYILWWNVCSNILTIFNFGYLFSCHWILRVL